MDTSGGTERRSDADIEPVTYHSRAADLYDEIMHRFAGKAVWDLTSLDGVLPLLSATNGIPYVGICQSEFHKTQLLNHLNASIFAAVQREDSPNYKPEL